MNKLTAKQEAFAQCLADGMTQSDAYKLAYDCAKMSDKCVWVNASKVAANDKVALRVAELKAKLENKQLWSREDSVKVLAEIAHDREGQSSARVSAIKEINAMHGFNEPIKLDHLSSDGSMATPSLAQLYSSIAKVRDGTQ